MSPSLPPFEQKPKSCWIQSHLPVVGPGGHSESSPSLKLRDPYPAHHQCLGLQVDHQTTGISKGMTHPMRGAKNVAWESDRPGCKSQPFFSAAE